ncbi:MAG TPA: ABC transporter ATP-binding protein [Acidimicrobiia bacterium]|nr:ABC transporter ATP-binding protein [Acidimicrobiia bacterium]
MSVPILEVRGVKKLFGGVAAVNGVDMAIEPGSITAVIGPNGAGKTSLFNVVAGFEEPTDGTIEFQGEEVTGSQPWQIAKKGLVRSFQTPTGFPALSVWENLMVGGSGARHESLWAGLAGGWRREEVATNQRARRLLEDLDLWEMRDTLLADLPPGDVKLVDFARQLMAEPVMLLLDEPASGVDPGSIHRLSGLIRHVRDQGVTVLVIDHNIGFVVGIADQIHVMSLGKVISSGSPTQVVKDPTVIEIYLGRSA